jgi:hypothetical protein
LIRHVFAHDAVVVLNEDGDPRAPGGAVTVALCGHWDHPPPCPLAPHHTSTTESGDNVALRILFAAQAEDEQRVREQIDGALASGCLTGPDGRLSTWDVLSSGASPVRPEEAEHAAKLAES